MDIEMSLGALEAFYQKHDPSKLANVDEVYEKYPGAQARRILKKKYGEAPEYTKKERPKKAKRAAAARWAAPRARRWTSGRWTSTT